MSTKSTSITIPTGSGTGRISKERMEKALAQLKSISKEDHAKVKALASIVRPLRSVLHKTPADHGMTDWEDI